MYLYGLMILATSTRVEAVMDAITTILEITHVGILALYGHGADLAVNERVARYTLYKIKGGLLIHQTNYLGSTVNQNGVAQRDQDFLLLMQVVPRYQQRRGR